eukprot:scaffold544_cov320-Pavlova_lutheri.AAC.14
MDRSDGAVFAPFGSRRDVRRGGGWLEEVQEARKRRRMENLALGGTYAIRGNTTPSLEGSLLSIFAGKVPREGKQS